MAGNPLWEQDVDRRIRQLEGKILRQSGSPVDAQGRPLTQIPQQITVINSPSPGTGGAAPVVLAQASADFPYGKVLTGTANQVAVTDGTGIITISTPQDIAPASSPAFTGLTVSGATANTLTYFGSSKALASVTIGDGLTLTTGTLANSDRGSVARTAHESAYDHGLLHSMVTAGTGISVTGQVVTNSDRGSTAVTTHEAAYDHSLIGTGGGGSASPNVLINGGFAVGQRIRTADPGTYVRYGGAVTGISTDFVTQDVGGWFKGASDSAWYSISGVTSTTALALSGSPPNVAIGETYQIARSVADDVYAWDRWYVLTQTAAVGVQRIDGPDTARYAGRLVQTQASAQRMGCAQIVEGVNSRPLRGLNACFAAAVRCSASTTVRYAIIAWTGAEDVVTSDVVNNWTSTTYTPGNFFLGSNLAVVAIGSAALTANTWATVSCTGVVGATANNLIVIVWTDSAQATGVTLDITQADLYAGSAARTWAACCPQAELVACQRYLRVIGPRGATIGGGGNLIPGFTNSTTQARIPMFNEVMNMRAFPTLSVSAAADVAFYANNTFYAASAVSLSSFSCTILITTSGLTAGWGGALAPNNTYNAKIYFDAEM